MSRAHLRLIALACAATLLPVVAAGPVVAATDTAITVTTFADGFEATDGNCTLREAIHASVNNVAIDAFGVIR